MFSYFKKKPCLLIDPGLNFFGEFDDNLSNIGHFPFGLLSIGSYLEKNGFDVEIIEFDYFFPKKIINRTREEILKDVYEILKQSIKDNNPLVIGISILCSIQFLFAFKIIEMIKSIDPKIRTVAGGSHVTFLDEQTLNECPSLDIVVRNEGEWTFFELLNSIYKNKSLHDVDGITFRSKNKIHKTKNRKPGNLNEIPVINFGLIPSNFYHDRPVNIAPTRGCYYNCTFCTDSAFWMQPRRETPVEKIFQESKILLEKYKISFLSFEDSMISTDFYFINLFSKLKSIKNRRFGSVLARIDGVNKELLLTLKHTGFNLIIYGLESGSQTVLKAMNKHINFRQAREIFNLTHNAGLNTGVFWIIGHPGDSIKESELTIDLMTSLYSESLIDTSRVYKFVPYPGTDYFLNPEKYDIEILHYNWERWGRCERQGVCQLKNFKEREIDMTYNRVLQIMYKNEIMHSLLKY